MILSARTISERLVESGCLPAGALKNDQSRMTMMDCETRGQNVSRDDRKETARQLVITPFAPESLQPASYDLRASQDIVLPRGTCTLVPSLEWVELPEICGDAQVQIVIRQARGHYFCRFCRPGVQGRLPCASSTWEMKISGLRRTPG